MIGELNEWCEEKIEMMMMVGDIKNIYTELLYREIVKVIEWLIERVRGKIRESKWV